MTTILLDLFGTLVDYSASRTDQGYPKAGAVLERAGCRLGYDDWLATWARVSEAMDDEANHTGVEFSMAEAYRAFAPEAGLDPGDREVEAAFLRSYLEEWSAAVRVVDGVPDLLARLVQAGHEPLLVSNTHDADMVRGHLDAMGLLPHLAAVVTSVEVGFRKPRPEIFAAALASVGAAPGDAVFVGDTFLADFVGPTRFGIDAYLIVADGAEPPGPVPADRRLGSVLEIEARLA